MRIGIVMAQCAAWKVPAAHVVGVLRLWSQTAWFQISGFPFTSCVTVGKSLYLSVPQFPLL